MYDSQVLEFVAGVLVSRLNELHAGQLVSVLESYGRLPRLRPSEEEKEETSNPRNHSIISTVIDLVVFKVQLLFEVAASALPDDLSQLQSFQLCAIAQAYSRLGFYSPSLLSAICEEFNTRLESDTTTGSSRRKPVTPLEAHRFIVSVAMVADTTSDEVGGALKRCVDNMITKCLYYTTTQLDTRGCLQLIAALRKLKHYNEKFVNTRLLPTLNNHYMKSRAAPAGAEEGLARIHDGVLIIECLSSMPQTTAMTARLQETILYDVIDSITAMDLPASVWKIVNFNKSVFKTEF
ncbi:hypothetical protein Pmar_PMAR011838 [Perkinsus marinus ATCC 50983]|uniref:Uncharacterized protein n=1 Tax=Perkinsus marinus (strain ATCC 50983 / TXsc) TaxID=423536 RepID=C5LBG8_PERM5|nr:hypothetical protein Pmar_PMAR011838 [Perkinsus marinus ATCC 50983]EER05789.1 hypothetical protein Pmar_PMAR011838 [Perkinsus marinus ATCC 50983]|eukprot:XP_002773973.1 hypothetical protein Pmar_PMAR011838 [Perkinsus marinus ATCC 50983]